MTREILERMVKAHQEEGVAPSRSLADLAAVALGKMFTQARASALIRLTRLMGLMEAYVNRGNGNDFVRAFGGEWLTIRREVTEEDLECLIGFARADLRQFYENTNLYCEAPEERDEEPLLFGPETLLDMTTDMLAMLKRALLGEL